MKKAMPVRGRPGAQGVWIAAVFGLAAAVFATDRFVAPGGTDAPPYTNWHTAAHYLQSAVDECIDGDVVWVTNGTYAVTNEIFINKAITVRSINPSSRAVILNGGGTNRCFYLNHADALIAGFVITNGFSDEAGGGVEVSYGGTVSNCLITGNRVTVNTDLSFGGGGVDFFPSGQLLNCDIVGNTAEGTNSPAGGGVLCEGAAVVVRQCTIDRNRVISAVTNGLGGGLQCVDAAAVERCFIRGNTVQGIGGGVACDGFKGGVSISDCTIATNFSTLLGGGFVIQTGELIVGRVTNSVGGVSGVSVTAGGVTTTTDSRGFFGVIATANTTNEIVTSKQGYLATTVSNVVVGSSAGNTQGNAISFVNIVQGSAFTLTAGTYSTNILLEWTNPTNASYTGHAHILWTTNSSQEWDTWSAPTGSIKVGVATNRYPTNNVVSGGSLGGAENSLYTIHSNRTIGVTYYYKVWITNSAGWMSPDTEGSIVTAQARPDAGNMTMYFIDNSASRLVRCLKFTATGEIKLNTTVATTNMVPYNIAGVGDFDSDNVDDILFQRNTSTNGAPNEGSFTNSWYVWFMQPFGKLKSQTSMNVNDLTGNGAVTVRGIAGQAGSNALIVARANSGAMRIYTATNGVIDTMTNYVGSGLITNTTGWHASMGVTTR